MAKAPTTNADGTPKVKRTRSASGPKKIYAIVRVIDNAGNAVELSGATVQLVSFERSAEQVLAKVGPGGEAAGAMLLQGMLPAGKQVG